MVGVKGESFVDAACYTERTVLRGLEGGGELDTTSTLTAGWVQIQIPSGSCFSTACLAYGKQERGMEEG